MNRLIIMDPQERRSKGKTTVFLNVFLKPVMGLEGSVVDNLCISGHNLRRRLPDISGCFTPSTVTHEYQDWQSLNQLSCPCRQAAFTRCPPTHSSYAAFLYLDRVGVLVNKAVARWCSGSGKCLRGTPSAGAILRSHIIHTVSGPHLIPQKPVATLAATFSSPVGRSPPTQKQGPLRPACLLILPGS